jgi:hypothetical protein
MFFVGSGESIQSIQVHDKVIVSMAANNRIAWHTFTDKEVTLICITSVFRMCMDLRKQQHTWPA